MVDNTCIVCTLSYNVTTRRPFDLGCGHCVCEQCFNTSKLAVCMECRQPTNNPHLQYTLLRMLQPSSPTSFPIGCAVDDAEEAPGTPHPSAPVMEVEPWEADDSGSDSSSRRSTHSYTASSLRNHLLRHQSSSMLHSSSSNNNSATNGSNRTSRDRCDNSGTVHAQAVAPSYPALRAFAASESPTASGSSSGQGTPLAQTSSVPVHALTFSSTWTAISTVSLGVTGDGGAGVCRTGSGRLLEKQMVSHQLLTSFPVEDFDLDGLDDSLSSSSGEDAADAGAAAAAEDGDGAVMASRAALAAVQAALGGCLGVVQQLVVPHMLFESGSSRPGWPAQGPSLLIATTSACWRTWAAYSTAVAHTLGQCQQLQVTFISTLGQLLARCGLPNAGHLAAYCLATWVLGMLLYHWQLGLGLLPVCAAGLALVAFGAMPSSSGGCLLWPTKLAGAVLAGDCLVLGLLGIAWQQLAAGAAGPLAGLYEQLLLSTPQVLLLALLLLWGQVAMEVISLGWSTYRELSFASLVVRCWAVAAAGVLGGRPVAAALAAVPWVQKAHLLLEGPVVVHHIGMLVQHSSTWTPWQQQQQQQPDIEGSGGSSRAGSSRAAARSRLSRGDSVSDRATAANGDTSGGMSAWLLCLHCLLQLVLLLFVPPAPLAAAQWLPLLVRGGLVWGSRVLLCGCLVQLLLQLLQPVGSHLPVGTLAGMSASPGSSRRAGEPAVQGAGSAAGNVDCSWRSAPHSGGCGSSLLLGPAAMPASALPGHSRWEMQLHGCNSHALAPASFGCAGSSGAFGGLAAYRTSTSGCTGLSVAAGAAAIVKQHVAYLGLLLLAAAGDSFIMAVPSAAAAGAFRAAWHGCVQQLLLVAFAGELASTLWHELQLLRQQQ